MRFYTVLLIISAISFSVYSAPIDNIVSSALMPGDSVVYNLDFFDPFGLPIFDIKVRSKTGGSEYVTTMEHIGTPGYLNTYEGTEDYSNLSGQIEFYGRVESDTLMITQSYKNAGNQFPPASGLYAELADDPVGDTLPGTAGQWLDITGSKVTYSDSRVYASLSNAGGGWPTNQGFDFYAYAFAFYNPGSSDLSALAMVYVNIPIFYPPGLYSINLVDTSLTRIADIQYQTSGNDLHMSCAISDIISDPNWTQWPPESGYVITGGITLSIISLEPALNDFTYPSAYIPASQFLNTNQNTSPVLGLYTIEPIPDVTVQASIEYGDGDNNLPTVKSFIFDNVPYDMNSSDHSYQDNSVFEVTIPAPHDDWHWFYFRFSDGDQIVETDLDSVYMTPIGVENNPIPYVFELGQNYPNPFNASTMIDFTITEEAYTDLSVYNIRGELIATLLEKSLLPGRYHVLWNGTDFNDRQVSSGVYLYKLHTGDVARTNKMMLLK